MKETKGAVGTCGYTGPMRVAPSWLAKRARAGTPGRPTEAGLRWFRRVAAPLVRWAHRPVLDGVAKLPDGPFLMVANHSGVGVSEIAAFITCWLEHVGEARPLTGMAHPFGFHVWPISTFMRHMGAIPSTYEAALDALASDIPVLVFPGGDWEASRPIWQANEVQFKGRKGFLRVAQRAGVPIVPLGIRGSVFSAPLLLRSQLLSWVLVLPRLLGVTVFPVSVLGVVGVVAIALNTATLGPGWTALIVWLWLASPFTLLPWVPVTIRMTIGEPIPHAELFGDAEAANDAELTLAYARVTSALQRIVDPSRLP